MCTSVADSPGSIMHDSLTMYHPEHFWVVFQVVHYHDPHLSVILLISCYVVTNCTEKTISTSLTFLQIS